MRRDAALLPAAGRLVPQGPARGVGAVGRPRRGSSGRWPPSGLAWMALDRRVSYPFLKGHGTENDFVLLPDHDGTVHGDLSAERVRALCDRRAGIGGDGVLRVIRADAAPTSAVVDRCAAAGDARVVHGLPQRRRLARGDVRQRDPGLRPHLVDEGLVARRRAGPDRAPGPA